MEPLTQDSCAFYTDHSVYDDFGGVAVERDEGARITKGLGNNKAVILQDHGLLTVGQTVDEAAFWFIKMERSCQVQLLAEAAMNSDCRKKPIDPAMARKVASLIGSSNAGWYEFQPLYSRIVAEQPDLLT